MAFEITENRMKKLAKFNGRISIEGERQNEIVIRILFDDVVETEKIYNNLLDNEGERCMNCGRYCTDGLDYYSLCERCRNKVD